ncbi:MAG TPA: AAA family ATPase [Motilibacterales bacterium]|nr:AAA family ATPase [Motilibacterales bacterium]
MSMLDEVGTGRLTTATSDVGAARERARGFRLARIGFVLAIPMLWMWWRILDGNPFDLTQLSLPTIDPFLLIVGVFFGVMIVMTLGVTLVAGRSPHITYRPEQIDVSLADVKGIDLVKSDVIRSLNLFLANRAFRAEMGGTPRRGLLFEGPPGTGKTHLAKAMAAEAGVPFLFVSATSFQSMYYGATARKIRSYFKALRKAARQEGGAIGFIEEIDAIAMARSGVGSSATPLAVANLTAPMCCGGLSGLPATSLSAATGRGSGTVVTPMISEGTGGVVNELLVQMQSFDTPDGWQKVQAWFVDRLNLLLPVHRQLRRPVPAASTILLIAATNRADNLDPALLRPGRFDRLLSFDPPTRAGRLELIDHFLDRKNHSADLDEPDVRAGIAAVTQGYTPVMIEHLFDEALVNALRRGDNAMNRADVESARLTEEIGMGQPVAYTPHETRLIATHESGHATMAHLVAPTRRLEVLSIIKRRDALGMLAHGDSEDVFTRSRTEMLALIQIAMGGQVAEEIFFGDVSTGPGGDLAYATTVAAQMVGAVGMGGSLISLAAVQQSALSDSNLVGRVLSDPAGRAAVETILSDQKQVARELLTANHHIVVALRDALIERHELVGRQIREVIDAAAPLVDLRVPAPIG